MNCDLMKDKVGRPVAGMQKCQRCDDDSQVQPGANHLSQKKRAEWDLGSFQPQCCLSVGILLYQIWVIIEVLKNNKIFKLTAHTSLKQQLSVSKTGQGW
jgi:hypothetical protein